MIEDVLDHSMLLRRTGGVQKFLVKAGPLGDYCTWITKAEFRNLNLVLLEKYLSLYSTELNLPKPRRLDGEKDACGARNPRGAQGEE